MTPHARICAAVAAGFLLAVGAAAAQSFEKLVDFHCSTIGCAPNTPLVDPGDGYVYGITSEGGPSGEGVVFRMDRTGAVTVLAPSPGPFFAAADGFLYGTAAGGWLGGEHGIVFRMDRAGALTTLYAFDGVTGSMPLTLVRGYDGAFYGLTAGGGAFGYGTLFRVDAAGTHTVLRSFTRPTGIALRTFLQGQDGFFYGTSYYGGPGDSGFAFRMTRRGSARMLYAFDDSPGGQSSTEYGDLMEARDGSLYGTTMEGGSAELGTVYRMTRAGKVTPLHTFTGPDGARPYGAPVEATDGFFYGTTCGGGLFDMGTVYRMDPAGTVIVLHSFDGWSGACPAATVVQGRDGAIYGTTAFGGAYGQGAAFRVVMQP